MAGVYSLITKYFQSLPAMNLFDCFGYCKISQILYSGLKKNIVVIIAKALKFLFEFTRLCGSLWGVYRVFTGVYTSLREFTGSLQEFTGSLQEFMGSLWEFTRSLREFIGSLQEFTVSVWDFTGSVWEFMGSLQEFMGSLQVFTGSLQGIQCTFNGYSMYIQWALNVHSISPIKLFFALMILTYLLTDSHTPNLEMPSHLKMYRIIDCIEFLDSVDLFFKGQY